MVNQAQRKTYYQLMRDNNKATMNFLHVFRYKYFFIRNQGKNLGKFKAKTNEAIFIGFALSSKAYKVIILILIRMKHLHQEQILQFKENGQKAIHLNLSL